MTDIVKTWPTSDTLLVSTIGHDLWNFAIHISVDKGETWSPIDSREFFCRSEMDLEMFDRNTAYLVCSWRSEVAEGSTLFLSENRGENWTSVLSSSLLITDFEIFNSELFASAPSGVYQMGSDNSWLPIVSKVGNVLTLSGEISSGNLIAGGSDGIHVLTKNSTDSLWSATKINSTPTAQIHVDSSSTLWAASENGVLISDNNGADWNTELPGVPIVAIDVSSDKTQAFVGTVEGYQMKENGQWTSSPRLGLTTSIEIFDDQATFIGGEYGLYRSSSAGLDAGLIGMPNITITDLTFDVRNRLWVGTRYSGIWLYEKDSNWTQSSFAIQSGIRQIEIGPMGSIFVTTELGEVFLSRDEGISWEKVEPDDNFFNGTFVGPSGDIIITAGFGEAPYFSDDHGLSWSRLEGQFFMTNQVVDIEFSKSGSDVFVATNDEIFQSGDLMSWQNLNLPRNSFSPDISLGKDGRLFASVTDEVISYDSTLNSWQSIFSQNIDSFEYQGANLLVGTAKDGFWISDDFGGSWTNIVEGMPPGTTGNTPGINAITVDRDGVVFIGTDLHGVFSSISPLTTSSEKPTQQAAGRIQNFPNPFKDETTIAFELPKTGEIFLKVYNSLGQIAMEKSIGVLNQGSHSMRLDGTSLESGRYFYVLSSGDTLLRGSLLAL